MPVFQPYAVAPSSAHDAYHQRAIQIYGRAKFEGRSAHQDDYQPWELPQQEAARAVERHRPALPFTATSTYSDVYKEHPLVGERPTNHTPAPYHGKPGPLFWSTEEGKKAVTLPVSSDVRLQGSGVKFDATSSYAQDFLPKQLPFQEPYSPSYKPRGSAKFDGTTSYADDFPVHQIDPEAHRRAAEALQRNTYKPRNIPFEATTAYKDTFVEHPLERDTPSAAPNRFIPKQHKFEGSTTHQDDFKSFQLARRRETLGVATVGDRMHVFIPSQMAVPALAKQTFTTVRDGQTEMALMIYEGPGSTASKNRLLGQFQLVDVPAAPVGVPKIQVTFVLDAQDALRVEALDLLSGVRHTWMQTVPPTALETVESPVLESQAVAVCA